MAHLAHLFIFLLFAVAMLDTDPPPTGGDGGGAPSGEGGDGKTSFERAQDYVAENPLFAPEEKTPSAVEPPKVPEAAKPAAGAAPPPAGGEPPAAAAPKPGEFVYDINKAVEKLEDFDKLPFAKDATFQKLIGEFKTQSQALNGLTEVFKGDWRESGTKYMIEGTDQLKGVLEDAFSLYDLGNLNMPVGEFMAVFEKNFPEGNVRAVLASLAAYIDGKGIKATEAADLNNPLNVRLTKVEAERKAERTATEARNSETARKEAQDKLDKHFTEFFKGIDMDVADELDYLDVLRAKAQHDPQLARELREGKFANLDKVLTEYHNRQVERQKRWMDAKIKTAEDREKVLPKGVTPTGGASPVESKPAPKPKIDLTDGETRRKEALRQFREPVVP